jgi:hypothetical protein
MNRPGADSLVGQPKKELGIFKVLIIEDKATLK